MPDEITDDQVTAFSMNLATKLVDVAGRVADAYVRKLDREADENMLPGEYHTSEQLEAFATMTRLRGPRARRPAPATPTAASTSPCSAPCGCRPPTHATA